MKQVNQKQERKRQRVRVVLFVSLAALIPFEIISKMLVPNAGCLVLSAMWLIPFTFVSLFLATCDAKCREEALNQTVLKDKALRLPAAVLAVLVILIFQLGYFTLISLAYANLE